MCVQTKMSAAVRWSASSAKNKTNASWFEAPGCNEPLQLNSPSECNHTGERKSTCAYQHSSPTRHSGGPCAQHKRRIFYSVSIVTAAPTCKCRMYALPDTCDGWNSGCTTGWHLDL